MTVFAEFVSVDNNYDDDEKTKTKKKKNVLVGIRINNRSRELLSWALVKVAEPGDSVIAIHVCPSSDQALKDKPSLDGYLDVYQGLCSVKKVELIGQIMTGSSARRVLVREAENYAAMALVLGISKQATIGSRISTAKYCAKRLSLTTDVLAIHNGKIVFKRSRLGSKLPGLKGDPKPSLAPSELGDSDVETETVVSFCETTRNLQDSPRHGSEDLRSNNFISRSDSVLSTEYYSMDHRLGWPLLRRANLAPKGRNVSVVQWVMSLPDRSPLPSFQCSTIFENSNTETEISESTNKLILSAFDEAPEGLQYLLQTSSYGCKYWFGLDVLKASTCQFSSENLIGRGGCNCVYKGTLPNRKPVAVKILNTSRERWKEFALEFDIISSLKHKHIAPLLGVCVEDNALISVYDYFPKGSLEESLHGNNKDKGVLSWEMRYNIAVGIAEALYYLHRECPQSVIHRDIKSSNILLSDDGFEPKLSDFGLAIWGPKTSSFLIEGGVVGTFGYLAPEYFMYGKVSDKIDVYAFGVVLLELLSGRRPIGSDSATRPKGQESLVMWAKPIIESGDVKGMLDPNLDGKADELQMRRMALAATLCITQSARLRPGMNKVLKILKGDKDVEKWKNSKSGDEEEDLVEKEDEKDDEVYPETRAELHLGVALLDVVVEDDTTSFSSGTQRSHSISLEDLFKGRWSGSPSFD